MSNGAFKNVTQPIRLGRRAELVTRDASLATGPRFCAERGTTEKNICSVVDLVAPRSTKRRSRRASGRTIETPRPKRETTDERLRNDLESHDAHRSRNRHDAHLRRSTRTGIRRLDQARPAQALARSLRRL